MGGLWDGKIFSTLYRETGFTIVTKQTIKKNLPLLFPSSKVEIKGSSVFVASWKICTF
jgi:hypothetical protein